MTLALALSNLNAFIAADPFAAQVAGLPRFRLTCRFADTLSPDYASRFPNSRLSGLGRAGTLKILSRLDEVVFSGLVDEDLTGTIALLHQHFFDIARAHLRTLDQKAR